MKFLESLGERMVRLVAPSVTADGATCGPWFYDSCVSGFCTLPWQDRIRYGQTCCYSNGICMTSWDMGDCGTCAAAA
ncbi:hypothetical protein [Nonomuraea sp. NPDC001831]|uniref:hypothetical protein n=1 Tax=Nonomuraea sp. NPDC001831 TaxID=3364340 RepID=UPI003698707C